MTTYRRSSTRRAGCRLAFAVIAVIAVAAACGPARASGHFCALRHPQAPPTYPDVLVERIDFAESNLDAACRMLQRHGLATDEPACEKPPAAQAVRCLSVPTDSMVDPLRRSKIEPGAVATSTGPRRTYRCRLSQQRKQIYSLVEASSQADIEAARAALGWPDTVARGSCLPAGVFDELFRQMKAEPPTTALRR